MPLWDFLSPPFPIQVEQSVVVLASATTTFSIARIEYLPQSHEVREMMAVTARPNIFMVKQKIRFHLNLNHAHWDF